MRHVCMFQKFHLLRGVIIRPDDILHLYHRLLLQGSEMWSQSSDETLLFHPWVVSTGGLQEAYQHSCSLWCSTSLPWQDRDYHKIHDMREDRESSHRDKGSRERDRPRVYLSLIFWELHWFSLRSKCFRHPFSRYSYNARILIYWLCQHQERAEGSEYMDSWNEDGDLW